MRQIITTYIHRDCNVTTGYCDATSINVYVNTIF